MNLIYVVKVYGGRDFSKGLNRQNGKWGRIMESIHL